MSERASEQGNERANERASAIVRSELRHKVKLNAAKVDYVGQGLRGSNEFDFSHCLEKIETSSIFLFMG